MFNRAAGVVISLAYMYNPYFLSDIYTRAALAETLALAIAPLVFLAFYRAMTEPGWRSYFLTSLALALLILTHPLSTLLFAGFLVAYALLLFIQVGPRAGGGAGRAGSRWAYCRLDDLFLLAAWRLEAGGLRVMDASSWPRPIT